MLTARRSDEKWLNLLILYTILKHAHARHFSANCCKLNPYISKLSISMRDELLLLYPIHTHARAPAWNFTINCKLNPYILNTRDINPFADIYLQHYKVPLVSTLLYLPGSLCVRAYITTDTNKWSAKSTDIYIYN